MSSHPLFRRALRAAVLSVTAVAGVLVAPLSTTPAHAAVGDLSCTAVYQITFSPALRGAGSSSTASGVVSLSNCLSLNGRYTALRAGTMTGMGPATNGLGLPCAFLSAQFQFRIDWTNGQHSDLNALINDDPLTGALGFNGTVTDGALKGDSVFAIGPFVPNLDCLLNGLTSMTGANQKVFS